MPRRQKKPKRARRVNYELLLRPDNRNRGRAGSSEAISIYALLDDVVALHHADLAPANILLAWRLGWKSDKDGKLVLGQCKKASDISKELCEHDFVILLNKEMWNVLDDPKKRALLDHELCHAAPTLNPNDTSEQKEDERGRKLWRIRKHDIEEFTCVVQRHGCYKHDLEEFARIAVTRLKLGPALFEEKENAAAV